MDALSFNHVSFQYEGTVNPALSNIDLTVSEGESLGIMGPTGAGKSTLLRIATCLIPGFLKGDLSGEVSCFGESIKGKKPSDLFPKIGIVFQDFETQLFSSQVLRDATFAPENLGLCPEETVKRARNALTRVGLLDKIWQHPSKLSGGEKQRLAIASNLTAYPELLLLDEPTSDLDPLGKSDIYKIVRDFGGKTIIFVGHESEEILRFSSQIVILNKGEMVYDGKGKELLNHPSILRRNGVAPPQLAEILSVLNLPVTLDVHEAYNTLMEAGYRLRSSTNLSTAHNNPGRPLIEVNNLSFTYLDQPRPALSGINLVVGKGEFVAILGCNGSGKSTLIHHLIGLIPVSGKGKILLFNEDAYGKSVGEITKRIGLVFQNPDHQIFSETIRQEVGFGPNNMKLGEDEIKRRVEEALFIVGLEGREDNDPFALTLGDRKKVALASVLAMKPEIIIMDEPTTGLDETERVRVMELLLKLNETGHTIIFVTHQMDLVTAYARRAILMLDGVKVADGPVHDVFSRLDVLAKCSLKPPPVTRLGNMFGCLTRTVKEFFSVLTTRDLYR